MYKFKKLQDPNNKFDVSEIEFSVDAETGDEIVQEFYFFMLASGFHKDGVLRCFEGVIEEFGDNEGE